MEAGVLALLLFFGYLASDKDESNESLQNENQVISSEKNEKFSIKEKEYNKFDYQVIGNHHQRFFEKNYQLQIKQFHYKNNLKKIDSITNLSINSSDFLVYNSYFNDIDKSGEEIKTEFNVKTKITPKQEDRVFYLDYLLNNKEYSTKTKKINYEMTIEDKIDLYVNKKIIITYKNNQYEIKLKELGLSNLYSNVEFLDCNDDITCEILKENTISYKKTKKEKKTEIKKTNTTKNKLKFKTKNPIKFDDYILHEVKEGDTISELSLKYNVPTLLIKKLNNINSTKIVKGQKIVISNKTTKLHKVEYGENLFILSKKYNKKIDDLKLINNLKSDQINENQLLIIEK